MNAIGNTCDPVYAPTTGILKDFEQWVQWDDRISCVQDQLTVSCVFGKLRKTSAGRTLAAGTVSTSTKATSSMGLRSLVFCTRKVMGKNHVVAKLRPDPEGFLASLLQALTVPCQHHSFVYAQHPRRLCSRAPGIGAS